MGRKVDKMLILDSKVDVNSKSYLLKISVLLKMLPIHFYTKPNKNNVNNSDAAIYYFFFFSLFNQLLHIYCQLNC